MRAILKKIEPIGPNVYSFWFRPEKEISYEAGQFIELTIPLLNGEKQMHWFTLSSSPTDRPLVSITTKIIDQPSDFKRALQKLGAGASVDMSEPMGDFILPKDKTSKLVFVAGGIGVTPFHSIIKYLGDTNQRRPIKMIQAVHSPADVLFKDLFKSYLKTKYVVISETEDTSWHGLTGRLTAKKIFDYVPDSSDALIYIAGPEPMVEQLRDNLEEFKISAERIVGDYFPNYTKI